MPLTDYIMGNLRGLAYFSNHNAPHYDYRHRGESSSTMSSQPAATMELAPTATSQGSSHHGEIMVHTDRYPGAAGPDDAVDDRNSRAAYDEALRRCFEYPEDAEIVSMTVTDDVRRLCTFVNNATFFLNIPRPDPGEPRRHLLDWSDRHPLSVILRVPGSLTADTSNMTVMLSTTAQLPMKHVEIVVNGDVTADGAKRACFAARKLLDGTDVLDIGPVPLEARPSTVVVSIHGKLTSLDRDGELYRLAGAPDSSAEDTAATERSGTIADLRRCSLPADASYLDVAENLAGWVLKRDANPVSTGHPFHFIVGGSFVVPEPSAGEFRLTSCGEEQDLIKALEKDVIRFATAMATDTPFGEITVSVEAKESMSDADAAASADI